MDKTDEQIINELKNCKTLSELKALLDGTSNNLPLQAYMTMGKLEKKLGYSPYKLLKKLLKDGALIPVGKTFLNTILEEE